MEKMWKESVSNVMQNIMSHIGIIYMCVKLFFSKSGNFACCYYEVWSHTHICFSVMSKASKTNFISHRSVCKSEETG
jgi:hypothetical protein